MNGKVTEQNILGTGKNLYLVNWSRCANFGYNLMRGDTEKDVYDNHLFKNNKEVNFIITKISENDMPVVFKQTGMTEEDTDDPDGEKSTARGEARYNRQCDREEE